MKLFYLKGGTWMIKARRLMIFCIMFCVFVFVNVTPVHSQSVQYGKLTGKVCWHQEKQSPGLPS
jgi:hypothetical protein